MRTTNPKPTKPLLTDVCPWCLSPSFATEFCRDLNHWELVNQQYLRDLSIWEQTHGRAKKPEPRKSAATPQRPDPGREPIFLPPGIRDWYASLGRRGGSSTSERKQAAARANGQRGGRPRV